MNKLKFLFLILIAFTFGILSYPQVQISFGNGKTGAFGYDSKKFKPAGIGNSKFFKLDFDSILNNWNVGFKYDSIEAGFSNEIYTCNYPDIYYRKESLKLKFVAFSISKPIYVLKNFTILPCLSIGIDNFLYMEPYQLYLKEGDNYTEWKHNFSGNYLKIYFANELSIKIKYHFPKTSISIGVGGNAHYFYSKIEDNIALSFYYFIDFDLFK